MRKAYIIVDEIQRYNILSSLQEQGYHWMHGSKKLLKEHGDIELPFVIVTAENNGIVWYSLSRYLAEHLNNDYPSNKISVVFDGRKDEKQVSQKSDKIKISGTLFNTIKDYVHNTMKDNLWYFNNGTQVPSAILNWIEDNQYIDNKNKKQSANHKIAAIFRYADGEDAFEVEHHQAWLVRAKESDNQGRYNYLSFIDDDQNVITSNASDDVIMTGRTTFKNRAYRFESEEQANKWVNNLTKAVYEEVD